MRVPAEPHKATSSPALAQLVRAFPWHACAFIAANAAISAANFLTGPPWWGFWVLIVTGAALALHYLAYKTSFVDETWVNERVQELNLKSYDRSHIEGLKERLGDKADRSEGRK